jgi:Rod binding domain-containing protein
MGVSQLDHGARVSLAAPPVVAPTGKDDAELRETFKSFVGETFFGEMLKAMRKTQGKPAYFHGGQAEEVFQQQLDQVLSEKLAEASSDRLSGPMYELFALNRK